VLIMKLCQEFKKQFKHDISTNYKKLALFAVLMIPLLYCVLFLKAFWDPTGQMTDIPIAVVNQDKGYATDDKTVNLGNDLANSLRSDNNVDWVFVSEKQADSGLSSKKYYVSLTIPSDFSSKVYSVDGSNPEKAQLIYKSRESTNYLATTLTNSVTKEVANTLSSQIIAKYFDNIFVNIKNTASDLTKASEAGTLLVNGLSSASYGSSQISSGLTSTINGSNKLVAGLTTLNTSQTSLTSGLGDAITGVSQLKAGAQTVSTGLTNFSTGISGSQSALTSASALLAAYIAAHPGSEVASELGTISQLVSGANSGLTTVAGGISQINSSVSSADTAKTTLVSGLTTLESELSLAKSGSSNLADGSNQLLSGANSLSSGLSTLSGGVASLSDGLAEETSGMIQLRDKLSSGAEEATASTESSKVAAETKVMSSPVTVTDKSYDKVANYGSGFAPYFICLALWVGGLVSFFAIDFTKKPNSKLSATAKYLVLCVVGVIQAVLVDLVLRYGLGLSVVNVWQYYAFTILISISFMAILQLIIQHLGDIGRYLAIVLLIFQLTSAAGTFPKETLPVFFKAISPYLPMTYGVQGLRDIIFSNDLSGLLVPTGYLVIVLAISFIINLLFTKNQIVKSIKKVI
jgi:putative membrane protein